jgi:polysaccharide biosynthesis PFTS motif protein
MSWTRYLVWDDYQAAAIVAFGQDRGRVQIVGAVPLTDTGAALPPLPPRVVGVFDVAPFKPARLAAMGLIPAFYTGAIAVAFLEDLHNALAARGYTMVLKQKRNIGNHADACYRRFLDRAAGDGTVLLIDPGVAAARLIRVCDAVVCMPFTSPALLAQGLGRPVAYYDPTASLPALSRQAHGLPMLAGPPALAEWLDTVLPTAIERSAQV